jgi:DNA-3-methyladenine glycosylase I
MIGPMKRKMPRKVKGKSSHPGGPFDFELKMPSRAGYSSAMSQLQRCFWATREPNISYHDREWGVPQHDDRALFEFIVLEGAQAGLSWEIILKKRDNYRMAFDQFQPEVVARFDSARMEKLLANPGIVRNRLKVASAIRNAKAFLAVQKEFGTFDKYIWSFVGGSQKPNHWKSREEVPARTLESDAMSKDLLKRGFKFVGSTICYAFMQATGMVNDHLVTCPRHEEIKRLSKAS